MEIVKILGDKDIREALYLHLLNKYGEDVNSKIVHEMGLAHGFVRIDLAVINGEFKGYEIKSEADNLKRLPRQIEEYNKVFDRMYIVTQRKHLPEIRNIVPKWWGIILVTRGQNTLNIKEIRQAKINPSISSVALSNLLWREEAISILKEKDLHKGYLSKPKQVIYQRLSECISQPDLKVLVSQKLRMRESWLVNSI